MPPAARRAPAGTTDAGAPGPLQADDVLADRYVLEEAVPGDGPATLWRAHDEVLARPVAVKALATPNKAAREAAQGFLDAAVRTGAVNHPGLVRVYDAALESRPGRGNDVAYVISEWVDGEPLDAHLRRVGALAPPDAADVLRQLADALSAGHAGGLVHGRVHPRNVLVTPTGRVRLTDTEVSAAARGSDAPDAAGDTRDLAAVLYALTTARWPAAATPQPGGSLPAAPVEGGQQLTPHQLRAGVPRSLDHVVTRGLEPGRLPALGPLRSPAALADAADAAVAGLREPAAPAGAPEPPSRLRRWLPWAAATAFVTVVGVVGWLLGLAVGDLPRRSNGVDAIVSTTDAPSTGATAAAPLDLSKAVIRDFDPEGSDRQENLDQVPNATDGVPGTAWATSRYRSPTFGGLKTGVGLLVDLGRRVPLHAAQVGFSAPGAQVELRVSDTAPVDAASMRTVAADRKGDQVARLAPPAGTAARYVLVWITVLPKDGDGYRVGISELRLS